MSPSVFDRLADVIRTTFRLPNAAISRETTADDVAGWDSLRHAILLMNVERAFAIRFDPAEVLDLDNVGALADVVAARIAQRG